jgi:hypothetical protein
MRPKQYKCSSSRWQEYQPKCRTDISAKATATRNGYFCKGHGQGPRANQAKPLQRPRPRPTKPPNRGNLLKKKTGQRLYGDEDISAEATAQGQTKPPNRNGHGQTESTDFAISCFRNCVHNADFNQQQTTRRLIRHSGSN